MTDQVLTRDMIFEQGLPEDLEAQLEALEATEDDLWDLISEADEDDVDMYHNYTPHNLLPHSRFPGSIFVCGLPAVPAEKVEKLKTALSAKVFGEYGDHEIFMEAEEGGDTGGVCIVTYNDPVATTAALKNVDELQFTSTCLLRAVKIDEFDQMVNYGKVLTEEELQALPVVKAMKIRKQQQEAAEWDPASEVKRVDRTDLRHWREDEAGREMLLLRYGQSETQVCMFDPDEKEPIPMYSGERHKAQGKSWCVSKVDFSPAGSYVVTHHMQGVLLWGGPEYREKVKLNHQDVKLAIFSPNEEYVLTWNGKKASSKDREAMCVHRVLTGQKLAAYTAPALPPAFFRADDGPVLPLPLWSPSGKFLVIRSGKELVVLETPTLQRQVDPQTRMQGGIKFHEIHGFDFSPVDDTLAVWVPERNQLPAKIVLIDVATRKEIASKNVFNTRKQPAYKNFWQGSGDYLGVLFTRMSRSGKTGTNCLEIFRLREKGVPVEVVEIKDANVLHLAWEPAGDRFAIISTDEDNKKRKVSFYGLRNRKFEFLNEMLLPASGYDRIYWAPAGQYWVMAGTGKSMTTHTTTSAVGELMFGQILADNKLEQLAKESHYKLTDVSWDPSSRFVLTAVREDPDSERNYEVSQDTGYRVWSFQGRLLYRKQVEELWNVKFRPHPPSLLSKDETASIKKDLTKFAQKYEALDSRHREAKRQEYLGARAKEQDAFQAVLGRLSAFRQRFAQQAAWDAAMERTKRTTAGWVEQENVEEFEVSVEEKEI